MDTLAAYPQADLVAADGYAGLWHCFQLQAGLLREADLALADLGLAVARRWEDHQEPGH
jgi:hypothetical protein